MAEVITVLSGKGGVGKSTLVSFVGKCLSSGKRVLLIDGDVDFRSLDITLGLSSMVVFDWSDVIFDRCTKEKARLFASESLHLLASPISLSEKITPEGFKKLLSLYAEDYDYIIIDSPAGLNEYTGLYTIEADMCIVVATPDDISLRAAYTVGDRLSKSGIPDCKMRLVLNKVDPKLIKKGIQRNLDYAVDKTYLRLLGVVPEDKVLKNSGNLCDLPLSDITLEAFSNIAARISGKDVKIYI